MEFIIHYENMPKILLNIFKICPSQASNISKFE